MCCFSSSVESVTNTRIFGRNSGKGTQFVAYQMHFSSKVRNAMILPLPTKEGVREESLRFLDLSSYGRVFSDLGQGFPSIAPTDNIESRSLSETAAESTLRVHKVGTFQASFVPHMKEFHRLDPAFVIKEEVWRKLPVYQDYSFAVFQLQDLDGEPHPMAFEFETRFPDSVFFPTVHIHDGQVHATEEFDHTLYCQDSNFDAVAGSYTRNPDSTTGLVRSNRPAQRFVNVASAKGLIDGKLLLHRRRMIGNHPNHDVVMPLRKPRWPTFLAGSTLFCAAALWPLAWIIRRRHRLQNGSD